MLIQTESGEVYWMNPEGQMIPLPNKLPPLSDAAGFYLQQRIEDNLNYADFNLLEVWTKELIAQKRAKAMGIHWQQRASLYRQVNVLRDLLIIFAKDKNETIRNNSDDSYSTRCLY